MIENVRIKGSYHDNDPAMRTRNQVFTEGGLLREPVTLQSRKYYTHFDYAIELPKDIQELFSYFYSFSSVFDKLDRDNLSKMQYNIYSDLASRVLMLSGFVSQFLNVTYALPVGGIMRISLTGGNLIELRRTIQGWDILSDIPDVCLGDKLEGNALFIHPTGSIVLIKNADGFKEYSRNCREAGLAICMTNSELVFNREGQIFSDYRIRDIYRYDGTVEDQISKPHQRDDMYSCLGRYESIEYIPQVSHLEQIKLRIRKLLSRSLLNQQSNKKA